MATAGAVGNIAQTIKKVGMIFPQAIKNNTEWVGSKGSTPVSVDTAASGVKAHYATITFMVGETDIAVATLKVWHSDDDSTYAEMVDFGTNGTKPSATDDNGLFGFDIDLRGKRRYLQIEAIAGNGTNGTYAAALCDLFLLNEAPSSDAERGYAQTVKA